ncbi:MIP/aquaporin family protein [Streptomyces cadmiisoli]|uniref:MIP/aquaporin family protein n=1 Tax=Streptomyces cadmiisoli TaxID=2184053 RepID=UPI0036598EFF
MSRSPATYGAPRVVLLDASHLHGLPQRGSPAVNTLSSTHRPVPFPPSGPAAPPGHATAVRPTARWGAELAATALMLLAVTVLFCHVFHPGSPLHDRLPSDDTRLLVGAVVSGAVVAALIASPLGRLSGAHMNPAVTLALWSARRLSGRDVPAYIAAQLAGSFLGTAVGRLVTGDSLAHPDVNHALLSAPPGTPGFVPTLVEAIGTGVLSAVVVVLARSDEPSHLTGPIVGALLAALIVLTADVSGGSLNPARQFGPWLMDAGDGRLWPYVVGPLVAAVVVGTTASALPARARPGRSGS